MGFKGHYDAVIGKRCVSLSGGQVCPAPSLTIRNADHPYPRLLAATSSPPPVWGQALLARVSPETRRYMSNTPPNGADIERREVVRIALVHDSIPTLGAIQRTYEPFIFRMARTRGLRSFEDVCLGVEHRYHRLLSMVWPYQTNADQKISAHKKSTSS